MAAKPPSPHNSLKPFFLIWGGQTVSLLGSQLVQFALIWWLTQTTGSATVLATASLVGMLPQVVLGPFVGVLVDRWNRRLTMLFADSSVALATLVLAYLFWAGAVQIWHVYVILFVRSLAGGFHWPAMQSSTTLMVPEEHLARIQGLNQMVGGGLNVIAAPLGALLLSLLPMQGILAIDVVTALGAILPLLFVFVPQPLRETAVSQTSYWADLRAGLRYVWSWPGLLMLMFLAMFINLVLSPAFSLLPLLVAQELQGGAPELGWVQAALGLGVLAGGLLLSVWGGFRRRIHTTLTALIFMGIAVFLLGIAPAGYLMLAIGAAAFFGVMQALVNGPLQAVFQATIEPAMQGRVMTLISSLAAGMAPLGLLIAGPVADLVGVRVWYLVGSLVTAGIGLAGWVLPVVRQIEDGPERAATDAVWPETAVIDGSQQVTP